MASKKTSHQGTISSPTEVSPAGPVTSHGLAPELDFMPQLWSPIVQRRPELRVELERLCGQGPTFDLEARFDPEAFKKSLKSVLETLDRASWTPEAASEVLCCIL